MSRWYIILFCSLALAVSASAQDDLDALLAGLGDEPAVAPAATEEAVPAEAPAAVEAPVAEVAAEAAPAVEAPAAEVAAEGGEA